MDITFELGSEFLHLFFLSNWKQDIKLLQKWSQIPKKNLRSRSIDNLRFKLMIEFDNIRSFHVYHDPTVLGQTRVLIELKRPVQAMMLFRNLRSFIRSPLNSYHHDRQQDRILRNLWTMTPVFSIEGVSNQWLRDEFVTTLRKLNPEIKIYKNGEISEVDILGSKRKLIGFVNPIQELELMECVADSFNIIYSCLKGLHFQVQNSILALICTKTLSHQNFEALFTFVQSLCDSKWSAPEHSDFVAFILDHRLTALRTNDKASRPQLFEQF